VAKYTVNWKALATKGRTDHLAKLFSRVNDYKDVVTYLQFYIQVCFSIVFDFG